MQNSHHKLMNVCMPVFDLLRALQSDTSKTLSNGFGETLYQALLTLEHHGLENHVPGHHVNEAKYALAALVDEAIMTSCWPGKSNWMSQSLQLRLFGEHLAGVNFYERLGRIRQGGELNLEVLEVFYVCLQLGFQGKYALTQQEELKALQVDIKHQLDLYKKKCNESLFIDFTTGNLTNHPVKKIIPAWVWSVSAASIIVVLYVIYGFRLHFLHQEPRDTINNIISQLIIL